MYDKFEAFQRLNKMDLAFLPTRYEVWQGGQMIEKGKTDKPIIAKVTNVNGEEKVTLTYIDNHLNNHLAVQNVYDEFVTSSDRLQLITIPQQTNAENSMAVQMFKMTIGVTREFKNFNPNEPFCCNLFILNGTIDKVTFSFSNPEKLIEFYSDDNDEEINDEDIYFGNEEISNAELDEINSNPDFDWGSFDLNEETEFNMDFEFTSSDHIRYENKKHQSGPHGGARRLVKVESDKFDNENFEVSIYNLEGDHPVWQNNIQMATKPMRIIKKNDNKYELRGHGEDQFGSSFSDYGLTIYFDKEGDPEKCILHMHDRGIDIEYLGEFENKSNHDDNNLIVKVAVTLLNLLIEEHEDGDSIVIESVLVSNLLEEQSIDVSDSDLTEAIQYINSFYSRPIITERWIPTGGLLSISKENGYYTEMTRSFLRDAIETIQ